MMSEAGDHARAIAHHAGELAGDAKDAIVAQVERRPRLRSAARAAAPYARAAAYGMAFAGGALLLARLFGPSTARRLGDEGGREAGRAFGEGVLEVQRTLGRGARFL